MALSRRGSLPTSSCSNADPVINIRNTQKIFKVMKAGRWVDTGLPGTTWKIAFKIGARPVGFRSFHAADYVITTGLAPIVS